MLEKTRSIIHNSFEIGIFLKALDGVLQIIGAVLIYFVNPGRINSWIRFLTSHELSQDPKDWIANHLVQFASAYSGQTQFFAAIYLLVHGVVKIFLVYNLWRKKLWAYPIAIIIFSLFGIYQIYRFTFTHSFGLALLTVLDAAVIILSWLEYEQLKANPSSRI